ncbi:MAG: PPC domain-containing protein, partial [Gemmatimonadota bacterium]
LRRLRGLGILLSTLLVAFGWTTPARAQGNLKLGQSASGSLSKSDSKLESDSSYYDMWTYNGKSGETIRVTLTSSDFDSYLSVGREDGGDFSEIDSDDDGAGGTNSKVVITLPEDGEYEVRVNSLSAGETGDYTVLVEQGDPSEVAVDSEEEESDSEGVATPLPEPTAIHAGQTAQGALAQDDAKMEDNSYYDLYTFQAKRGQRVTITMRSTAFDSYLAFGRIEDGSFNTLESDDDSGGGEDAKVEFNIPRDGEYAIRANSLFENVTGNYSVQLESGAAPPPVPATFAAIRLGQTVNGELVATDPSLDDDSHYDLFRFSGKNGDKLVVTMKSTAFDTYLAVGRMEGDEFTSLETNDDGAGGTDSKVEITLDHDGDYVIRANSLFAKALGAYTINLVRLR